MTDGGWLSHFGVLAALAVVPFLVVVCTSFAKVVVVLGITRNALGGQTVIPTTVITALAVVTTLFIMGPVVDEMLDVELPAFSAEAHKPGASGTDSKALFEDAIAIYKAVSPPLLRFLRNNTSADELAFFSRLDKSQSSDSASVRVLLLAFASSELVEAFVLGFLVLLPFLVLDLIVANTLSALGLTTISVPVVALPLKLLLFVAADGWHLLINALMVSYGTT